MKKDFLKKGIVINLVFLLIITTFIPCMNSKLYVNDFYKKDTSEIAINRTEDTGTMSFYIFDKSGTKKINFNLPNDKIIEISKMFEELRHEIFNDPKSANTEKLKADFIDKLEKYGLITNELSKQKVSSLLNPNLLKLTDNSNINDIKPQFFDKFSSKILSSFLKLFYRNYIDKNKNLPSSNFGISALCSVSSGGDGVIMPLFMLPRPRLIAFWRGGEASLTLATNLINSHGYVAIGPQAGIALGFMGIGLTYGFFNVRFYGLLGYSLLAGTTAFLIETYPPNNEPTISNENPSDNSINVPLSLSELSFRIDDADNDRISYTVTTNPDIGSGQGNFKLNGIYKVDVSNLKSNTHYTWSVVVTDTKATTEKTFSFITEQVEPSVTNPDPSDGSKNLPIDLNKLSFKLKDYQGDLMDFTVETSPDIGSDSKTGVGDGTYSIDISGLNYDKEYKWFVNVTDGVYNTNEVFNFKTRKQPASWWNNDWAYRKEIIVNYQKVEDDFSNFPILVNLESDNDLTLHAQDDGDDIVFVSYSGTKLNHEIELFNGNSGELASWVNCPTLTPETIIYMYYGNPTCDNQQNIEGTWNDDYVMVQHLEESSGTHFDSTANNHDTSVVQVSDQNAEGKIAGADDFEAEYRDYLEIPDSTDWGFGSNPVTISMWVKMESERYILFIQQIGSWEIYYYDNTPKHLAYSPSSSIDGMSYEWSYSNMNWYYLTYTRVGNTHSLYVNGELGKSVSFLENPPNSNGVVFIGKGGEPYAMDGAIDEVRILDVGRGHEWLSTEYNNQNNPSDFMNLGPEESTTY